MLKKYAFLISPLFVACLLVSTEVFAGPGEGGKLPYESWVRQKQRLLPVQGSESHTLSVMSVDRGGLARHRAYGVRYPAYEPDGQTAPRTKGDTDEASQSWQSLQAELLYDYEKESTNTFGKTQPPIPVILKPLGVMNRDRDWPERVDALPSRKDNGRRKRLQVADQPITPRCLGEPTDCRMGVSKVEVYAGVFEYRQGNLGSPTE